MAINVGSVGASYLTPAQAEPERGFLGTMLSEIGKDFKGAAKTVGAVAFSPLDFLGAEVPVSFSDLTSRDIAGALMVAAGFVGAGVTQGLRGAAAAKSASAFIPSLPGVGNAAAQATAKEALKQFSFLHNAALAAIGEATAGAAFGALKPLERGDDRLEEILKEGALFGSFGAVGSVIASGWRSTVGAQHAIIKSQRAAAESMVGIQRAEASKQLKERVGIWLHNPNTGEEGLLRRDFETGKTIFEVPGDTSPRFSYDDYSSGLFQTIEDGYTINLGPDTNTLAREQLEAAGFNVDDLLEGGVLDFEGDTGMLKITEQLDLKNYSGVRTALDEAADANALAASLDIENLVEHRTLLGEFDPNKVQDIAASIEKLVPKKVFAELAPQLQMDKTGSRFIQEALRRGVLSVDNFADGITMKDWMQELVVSGRMLGDVAFVTPASYDASFLVKAMTSQGVVKLHPELAPWLKMIDEKSMEHELGAGAWQKFIQNFPSTYKKESLSQAIRVIADSQTIGGFEAGRAAALKAAAKAGDEVVDAVGKLYNIFNVHKLRRVAKGMSGAVEDATKEDVAWARQKISEAIYAQNDLVDFDSFTVEADLYNLTGMGRVTEGQKNAMRGLLKSSGIDPFRAAPPPTGYRVKVGDTDLGIFKNLDTAYQELSRSNATGTATILPVKGVDSAASKVLNADEIKRHLEAEIKKGTIVVDEELVKRIRREGLDALGDDLKKLRSQVSVVSGLETIADDPFRALDFYGLQQESAIANYGMDDATEQFIKRFVPEDKSMLRAFIRQKTALLQGRPTPEEELIDNFFKRFAPEFNVFKLKKFSQSVRRIQSFTKLGGVWSGLVNATQFAVNGGTVLGAKYTARGLETVLDSTKRKEFATLLRQHNKSLGMHGSLSAESMLAFEEQMGPMVKAAAARWSIGNKREALSAARQAAENGWMMLFNGAEKFNRFATAAGAYAKAIDETPGISPELALEKALAVVERTQFNYRSSNIPLIMQGPVGSVLFQFKSFFVNQAEFIASLNREEQAKFAAIMIAGGGLSSVLELPGVDLVDGASKIFFDMKLSEALKIGEAQQNASNDSPIAKAMIRFGAYGGPGALAGFDLSGYIGPGSLSDFTRGFLGPSGSDAAAFLEMLKTGTRDIAVTGSPSPDTFFRFIRQVMPSQIRRINTGMDIISSGEVRSPYSGKLIYKPDNRLRAAVAAGIGIPMIRDTSQRVIDDYLQRVTEDYRGVRESYRKRIALAYTAGDGEKGNALVQKARERGISFSPSDVRRAVESFSLNVEERRRLRTPRDLRDGFLDDFEGIVPAP